MQRTECMTKSMKHHNLYLVELKREYCGSPNRQSCWRDRRCHATESNENCINHGRSIYE